VKPYYSADGITIYLGDCRDVLPHITADVLVTDPPYGINFAGQPTKWQRRAGRKPKAWDAHALDFVPALAARFADAVIWGGNYYPLPTCRGWLCWVKPDAPPSMGSFELAWTTRDAVTRHLLCSISESNRSAATGLNLRWEHPSQKPLKVMQWTLGFVGEGLIVDPFMGSGTTLVAAKERGRQAIGIDLEEEYCEMAAKRLAQRTLFGVSA
jgi:DNA modification methylase